MKILLRLLLVITGLVSGFISYILLSDPYGFILAPGLVFGIATIWLVIFVNWTNKFVILRTIGWIGISTATFYLSYLICVALAGNDYITFFVAGAFGSFVMTLTASKLLEKITMRKVLFISLIGGIVSSLPYPYYNDSSWIYIFMTWQTLVLYLIGDSVIKTR